MIVGSSSGVTLDLTADASFSGEMIHNVFSCGGATDVSETDEEEFHITQRARSTGENAERLLVGVLGRVLSEFVDRSQVVRDGFSCGDAGSSIDCNWIATGEYFTALDRFTSIGFPVGTDEAQVCVYYCAVEEMSDREVDIFEDFGDGWLVELSA